MKKQQMTKMGNKVRKNNLKGVDFMYKSNETTYNQKILNTNYKEETNMNYKNNNENLIKEIGRLYNKHMNTAKNEDYIENPEAVIKFIEALRFFEKLTKECNGTIEEISLTPRAVHGGITASFYVFDLCGREVEEFTKISRYFSALTIDSMTDGKVCISATVPNVFVRKAA